MIADLYRENGWEPAIALLREAGLALQFEPYGGPFDTVAGAALADLPMGEFWSNSQGGVSSSVISAGRAAGRRVIGAEAFTGRPENSRWDETPGKLRLSADGTYLSGVNRLVLHHWVHQPLADSYKPGFGMGWWGVHFGRNQTWFEPGKAFFGYLGRVQAMLQTGEQSVDVLSVGRQVGGGDVIPPHVFLRGLRVESGRFVTPGGRIYPVLVVPHGGALTPEFVRRIGELVRAGGAVVCARPARSPSLQNYPDCDAEVTRLAAELWGEAAEKVRPLGQGRLFADGNLQSAQRALDLGQPWALVRGENASSVGVLERNDPATKTRFFFVASKSESPARVTASFRVAGLQPELWDADDGTIRPALNWRVIDGRTEVDLDFPGLDSVFVVFRTPTQATGVSTPALVEKTSVVFDGPWRVEFPTAAAASRTVDLPRLASWTEQAEPALRYYSGTATYRATLRLAPASFVDGGIWRLELGAVADMAQVSINGQSLGVLWRTPFRIDLGSAVRPGENTLEIKVTNTWHNRLVGDEQEPADLEWGPARKMGGKDVGRPLARFPAWLLENAARPSAGRTTFVTWNYFTKDEPLLPAGLLDPVRVVLLSTLKP